MTRIHWIETVGRRISRSSDPSKLLILLLVLATVGLVGEARDFVADRAKRLAELAWEYKTASDTATKEQKKQSMNMVQQTIDNELTAVALHGEAAAKDSFKKVLNTVTKTFVKVIPTLLSLI